MNEYDATEIAFKNGYEKGVMDTKSEVDKLEYTLLGVMHSVDKWLEGDELEKDEVNRAITMREKTLQLIETANAEIERLHKRNGENTDFLAKLIEAEKQKCKSCIKLAEAEAIKEFAKRVKEEMQNLARIDGGDATYFLVGEPLIDDIEKQMLKEV